MTCRYFGITRQCLTSGNVDTGVNSITKANMDSERSQALLNPKLN